MISRGTKLFNGADSYRAILGTDFSLLPTLRKISLFRPPKPPQHDRHFSPPTNDTRWGHANEPSAISLGRIRQSFRIGGKLSTITRKEQLYELEHLDPRTPGGNDAHIVH